MNYLPICVSARSCGGDLAEIDQALSGEVSSQRGWLILVKHALTAIANVVDLERLVRPMYRDHPELSQVYKPSQVRFELAKYARNILVGHNNPALVAKAFEWRPEMMILLFKKDHTADYLLDLFLLEAAINTFVDRGGKSRVFDTETDLAYHPEWERFLTYLADVVRGAMTFVRQVGDAALGYLENPGEFIDMQLYIKAGGTKFEYISSPKGRR